MRFFDQLIASILAAAKWLARAGALFGLIPWSIIVLVTSWSLVRNSTLLLERFPDTGNPGYFIIKLALLLMALLVLIEGLLELMPSVGGRVHND